MPNRAWSGCIQPLDIDESRIADFLPGTKGIWDGELYSIGLWDAAVAMVTRRSHLEDNGIRAPTLDEPWTKDEFMGALDMLKATGEFEYPLTSAWPGPASGIPTPSRRSSSPSAATSSTERPTRPPTVC